MKDDRPRKPRGLSVAVAQGVWHGALSTTEEESMARKPSAKSPESSVSTTELFENAGRHLCYALRDYAAAKRLKRQGKSDAAAIYRQSARKYMAQAKRFARQTLAIIQRE